MVFDATLAHGVSISLARGGRSDRIPGKRSLGSWQTRGTLWWFDMAISWTGGSPD